MTRKGEPQPQWTRLQEMRACRMREAGTPVAEIAAALGKTYGAVSVRLSKLGATKVIGRPRRKRGEFLAAVAELCSPRDRNKRMSDKDIAAALGAYPQEVFRARKRLGVPKQISPRECGRRAARNRYGNHRWGVRGGGRENDTPLTPAQSAVAAQYVRLAVKVAREWLAANRDDPDEVESAALLGLCRAARGHAAEKGVPFINYAAATIRLTIKERVWRTSAPLGFREGRESHLTPPKVVPLGGV